MPWLEQFAKHAVKSPVYADSTSFSWLPVLFVFHKIEIFVENDVAWESKYKLRVFNRLVVFFH